MCVPKHQVSSELAMKVKRHLITSSSLKLRKRRPWLFALVGLALAAHLLLGGAMSRGRLAAFSR